MADFINTIDVLGDDAVIDSIIDRTIAEFKDNVVTKLGKCSFFKCTALTIVDIPAMKYIMSEAFASCSSLRSVILRGETMCTAERSNIFSSTPVASGAGYIYVPRALLSDDDAAKDYRRATNFSAYGTKFRALEDYTVDGTITGELDETKI